MRTFTRIFFFSFLICTLNTYYAYAQLVPDFRVNENLIGDSYNGQIGVDSKGNYTITWQELIVNRLNVYAQRFNFNSQPLNANFRVNDIPDSSINPAIAVAKNGKIIICWGYRGIKCRIYNNNGQPISTVINVNDSVS